MEDITLLLQQAPLAVGTRQQNFDCSDALQVWNRDVAAARNMLRVVLAAASQQPRPEALRRTSPAPVDELQAVVLAALEHAMAGDEQEYLGPG